MKVKGISKEEISKQDGIWSKKGHKGVTGMRNDYMYLGQVKGGS